MAKLVSGRQPKLKLGVKSFTEDKTVLEVTGNIGIGTTNAKSDLDIVGNQNITGIITAGSVVTDILSVSGVVTFANNIDANGDLDVDGHTELDDVNISGVSTFAGSIDANGDLDVDGRTELDITNISETLNVVGVSTFVGLGTFKNNLFVNENVSVAGSVTADRLFSRVFGEFQGTSVTADTVVGTSLSISGISTFFDVGISGITTTNNLQVNGISTFVGFSTFNSNVYLAGISSVGTAITMYPSTGIVSATSFHGNLVGTADSTTNIPNLTGDITSDNTATTLATVNSNTGTFGSSTAIPAITVNEKGLITAATTNSITVGDGQLNLAVSGTGLSGSATFTANQSTGTDSTFTVTSNATNANTNGTIVSRDGSGNFAAGTITAALSGNATSATTLETARNIGGVSFDGSANINLPGVNATGNQDTTGNADTATTLETARNIGGVSFDGSANINLPGVNEAGNQNTSGTAAGLSGSPSITVNAVTASSLDVTDKFITTGVGVSIINGSNTTATIAGPATLVIDPDTVGDNTGAVRIKGDLFVDGTTTQINSTTIELADFIVGIATTATTDNLADGAGIKIGPNNTLLYENSTTSLKSSENINVSQGKGYMLNGTTVLSGTTLGSSIVTSSLTSLGTITTGVWQGTAINDTYIGTIDNANKVALSSIDLDGGTDIGAALADADLFIVDDGAGGTNRKSALSRIPTYVFGKISGDVTIASNGTASIGSGVIVNDDISGSAAIANSKLEHSSVSFGGISLSLGGSDATPAFDLTDATNYPTSSLSGTITNAQLAGSIEDSKLNQITTANKIDIGSIDLDGATEMNAALVDADLFLVDDGGNGTEKSMLASRLPTYVFGKVSGDVTIASNGTASIGSGVIVNADISSSAAIANSKLANDSVSYGGVSLDLGQSDATPAFDLTDAINYPTSSLSGTITNAQLAGSITDSKLNQITTANKIDIGSIDLDGGTDIGANLADADLIIVDDGGGGTNRKSALSRIPTYVFGKISGDIAIASNGTASIGSGVIVDADISGSAAIANSKLANSTISGVSLGQNLENLTPGNFITGDTYNGGTARTFAVDATSANTASKVVVRNASGGFSAGIITASALKGFDYLEAPHGSTVNFTVTVATKVSGEHRYYDQGSGNGYVINGTQAPFLTLTPGRTYRFTLSSTDMTNHPFRFYLEADKTTAYTTNVTSTSTYTEITVTDTTPQVLHYQCSSHALMGNAVSTNSNFADVSAKSTLADDSSDTTCFPVFANDATGNKALKTDSSGFTYNAGSQTLSVNNLSISGSTTGISAQVSVGDETSDTTCFPLFATSATGTQDLKSAASKLTYNSSTGEFASTVFKGKGAAEDASGNTVRVTISNSAPSNPGTGDIWIDIS